ncbi:MAG: carbonic anhydrase [Candidatus Binataceae bacterium]
MGNKKLAIAVAVTGLFMAASFIRAIGATRSKVPPVSAAVSLQRLLDGNRRFSTGKMEHPRQTTARRDEVAQGQYPFAAVLACSDSRTAPEIVFDQGLGDLFVVRVAGNVADHLVIESLDYAVTHLNARLVVVMGHTHCGAIKAAVEGHDEPDEDVGPMLRELRPAVDAAKSLPGDVFDNASKENVRLIVKDLSKEGPLAPMIQSGELKIVGAMYDIDTGKVTLLDK